MGRFSLSLLLIAYLTGCSTLNGSTQPVTLTCAQPGTEVRINGEKRECPSTFELPRNQAFTVEAMKSGYSPYSRRVESSLGLVGKLDVAGTIVWFFPVFGLMTPGAWDLDQTNIKIDLFSI